MRFLAGALLAALAGQATPAAPPAAPGEMRGLWIVRTALVSPESVDRAVDEAAEAGFNALFVQVRGRGDAFYASRLVARSELLAKQPAPFDPLARLLSRARGRGLEVHAWVNVLLAAHFLPLPADHVVARHPDWVMVPRLVAQAALQPGAAILPLVQAAARGDADVEGYYLSPSAAGAAEHLEQVVRELLREYAVDGLHLDFIRYPNRDYDYSRSALQAFALRQNTREPLQQALAAPGSYADYRREALTALADRLAKAARQQRPGLLVSAAVVPDEASALGLKFQDWPGWVARGILDAVAPMTYTVDERVYREQVSQARSLVGKLPLWAGVGAYRLSLDATIERIAAARASGASGVLLFSHESLQGADLRRLREQGFGPAAAPRVLGGPASAR